MRELTVTEGREIQARYPSTWTTSAATMPEPCADLSPDFLDWPKGIYTCTRHTGHDGPHVAHAMKGASAIWNEEVAMKKITGISQAELRELVCAARNAYANYDDDSDEPHNRRAMQRLLDALKPFSDVEC